MEADLGMAPPTRTITVVGLSLRDETVVRSLVEAMQGRSAAHWRFVDDLDADVALCAPDSPLSRVALSRGRQSGRPRCVCYGEPVAGQSTFETSLRLPVRVSELWGLLDGLCRPAQPAPAAPTAPSVKLRPDLAGLSVAQAVSALLAEKSRGSERWLLRLGAITFEVAMPERTVDIVTPQDCTFDALVEEACAVPVVSATIVARSGGEEPRTGRKSLDALLWRIGSRDVDGPAALWARDATPVRLRRWPDFGRLGAHRPHLAMASQLTRAAMTPADLAAAVECGEDQVRAFLNACALLGLIQIEAAAAANGPAARPAGGLTKLMRSFRAALGMGD